ncbi:glycosyltransferase family 2 protein [Achromobacter sp. SIMBA_011]|jgi:glycosyltransferase involved in cell wall biosynthesis|uniref:glycosyltransferase family 2 protein n=2 Tax=Alcaligenaceae TaxID=506 RepID=UPI0011AAC464|nr:glycosyltransferase family 2 protein [Achromobacter dolens]MCZ8407327.1 glycosyltransferase family 2 protein [Achromobacter dolens]
MKISIITVVFNGATTIGDTLDSVNDQTYPDVEHVVIDGGSRDNTLDIVKARGRRVGKLVSERDRGIYDAMNKGLKFATGDVIGFLNADDFYVDPAVLEDVAKVFADERVQACYGDLLYVSQEQQDKIVRYWKSSDFVPGAFGRGWVPPHPTFFVRREVYEKLGGFNLDFRIAADFELMMRFIEVHRVNAVYVPRVMIRMRLGGTTNKSIGNIIKQNREIMTALRLHGARSSWWRFIGHKVLARGKQFLVRPSAKG